MGCCPSAPISQSERRREEREKKRRLKEDRKREKRMLRESAYKLQQLSSDAPVMPPETTPVEQITPEEMDATTLLLPERAEQKPSDGLLVEVEERDPASPFKAFQPPNMFLRKSAFDDDPWDGSQDSEEATEDPLAVLDLQPVSSPRTLRKPAKNAVEKSPGSPRVVASSPRGPPKKGLQAPRGAKAKTFRLLRSIVTQIERQEDLDSPEPTPSNRRISTLVAASNIYTGGDIKPDSNPSSPKTGGYRRDDFVSVSFRISKKEGHVHTVDFITEAVDSESGESSRRSSQGSDGQATALYGAWQASPPHSPPHSPKQSSTHSPGVPHSPKSLIKQYSFSRNAPFPMASMSPKRIKCEDEEGNKVLNDYVILASLGSGSFSKVKLALCVNSSIPVAIKVLKKKKLQTINLATSFAISSPKCLQAPEGVIDDEEALDRSMSYGHSPHPSSMLRVHTALHSVHREIRVMKKIRHTNLVRLCEVIDDDECDKLYLVLEYMGGGCFCDTPDPTDDVAVDNHGLDGQILRSKMEDVLCGLYHLHRNKVIHNDIKPDNILMDTEGVCKLADFGVCTILEEETWDTQNTQDMKKSQHPIAIDDMADDLVTGLTGTPLFYAPEMIKEVEFHGRPADVWALGVTFYIALYGIAPFRGATLPEIQKSIVECDLVCPTKVASKGGNQSPREVPDSLRDVLYRMLCKEPSLRITVSQLLGHPFFRVNIPLEISVRYWKEAKLARCTKAEDMATAVVLRDNCESQTRLTKLSPDVLRRTPLARAIEMGKGGLKGSLLYSIHHNWDPQCSAIVQMKLKKSRKAQEGHPFGLVSPPSLAEVIPTVCQVEDNVLPDLVLPGTFPDIVLPGAILPDVIQSGGEQDHAPKKRWRRLSRCSHRSSESEEDAEASSDRKGEEQRGQH